MLCAVPQVYMPGMRPCLWGTSNKRDTSTQTSGTLSVNLPNTQMYQLAMFYRWTEQHPLDGGVVKYRHAGGPSPIVIRAKSRPTISGAVRNRSRVLQAPQRRLGN